MADDLQTADETHPVALESIIERYDDQPNECTLYRSDVPERRRLSTWISAKEGSYVDLQLWR
jgi:hypothetical protein